MSRSRSGQEPSRQNHVGVPVPVPVPDRSQQPLPLPLHIYILYIYYNNILHDVTYMYVTRPHWSLATASRCCWLLVVGTWYQRVVVVGEDAQSLSLPDSITLA
jgi:hypothetical protein